MENLFLVSKQNISGGMWGFQEFQYFYSEFLLKTRPKQVTILGEFKSHEDITSKIGDTNLFHNRPIYGDIEHITKIHQLLFDALVKLFPYFCFLFFLIRCDKTNQTVSRHIQLLNTRDAAMNKLGIESCFHQSACLCNKKCINTCA
jgi:hypothetical protein